LIADAIFYVVLVCNELGEWIILHIARGLSSLLYLLKWPDNGFLKVVHWQWKGNYL